MIDAESAAVDEISLVFAAADGYELGGTLYAARGGDQVQTVVLFGCGGGVSAARYRYFARYLAAKGIPTLTYDYRGIGASRPSRLRRLSAYAEDWSESDCAAAIDVLRARFPHAELVGIAHSIGALVMMGAQNIANVSRFVLICPHTGYFRDYSRSYRIPMYLLWHVLMPLLTRLVGFFPGKYLGLGEDIPKGVALQWAARRSPDLKPEATARDATRARRMMARYAEVSGDAYVIGFSDDAFATRQGADRLLDMLPCLRASVRTIHPAEVGMASIGHFGFFSRRAQQALWDPVVAALKRNDLKSSATDQCRNSPCRGQAGTEVA